MDSDDYFVYSLFSFYGYLPASLPELYPAAHLKDAEHLAEVTIAGHGAHEDRGGQRAVGKGVVEVIPSAELFHDAAQRLVLEDESAVKPASDDGGVDSVVVKALGGDGEVGGLTWCQDEGVAAAGGTDGHAAFEQGGIDMPGIVGVDIELGA